MTIPLDAKKYYDALGVTEEATFDEIKKAYRKGMREAHPDKNPENIEAAEKRTKALNEAYGYFSERQKAFDAPPKMDDEVQRAADEKQKADARREFEEREAKFDAEADAAAGISKPETEAPQAKVPKAEAPQAETPKAEAETLKDEVPKPEAPTAETSKTEAKAPAAGEPEAADPTFRSDDKPEHKSQSSNPLFEQRTMHQPLGFNTRRYALLSAVVLVVALDSPSYATARDIQLFLALTLMLSAMADMRVVQQTQHEADLDKKASIVEKPSLHDLKQQLKDLEAGLRDKTIDPQSYNKQLERIEEQLISTRKDSSISLQEDHLATNLLRRVDRMKTMGLAEEVRGNRQNESQSRPDLDASSSKKDVEAKQETTVAIRMGR